MVFSMHAKNKKIKTNEQILKNHHDHFDITLKIQYESQINQCDKNEILNLYKTTMGVLVSRSWLFSNWKTTDQCLSFVDIEKKISFLFYFAAENFSPPLLSPTLTGVVHSEDC